MNQNIIITCAVTGVGDSVGKNPHIPVSPRQIADAAIQAANAGATVVHCHVRDPQTGKGSRDPVLYRELMEHIKARGVDMIVNLTTAWGVIWKSAEARAHAISAPAPIWSGL